MSVQVANLTKVYGKQKAVDNISFEARPGEVLGFLGPNGAGKTTTMKVITCFIPQTDGKVEVCGHDVQEDPMAVRQLIGYLPEHNPLYLDMYVREYLAFVARLHKVEQVDKSVDEMIDLTGLGRERHKLIGQLSKGYRQRVGLAQAMIHDPQVLILDEPTSGLDPNQLAEVRALIRNMGKEKGKTVILSSHIMQEVQAVCDRIFIINKGKAVANDSAESLRQRATGRHVLTVAFTENINEQALKTVAQAEELEQVGMGQYRIITSSTEDVRPAIFNFAVEQQHTLITLHQETSSLEDVFRELTTS